MRIVPILLSLASLYPVFSTQESPEKNLALQARQASRLIDSCTFGDLFTLETLLRPQFNYTYSVCLKALAVSISYSRVSVLNILLRDKRFIPKPRDYVALFSKIELGAADVVEVLYGLGPTAANIIQLFQAIKNEDGTKIIDLVVQGLFSSKTLLKILSYAGDMLSDDMKRLIISQIKNQSSAEISQDEPSYFDEFLRIVSAGQCALARRMLETGSVDPSAQNNIALMLAIRNLHPEVMQLLLEHPSVDPSSENSAALCMAMQVKSPSMTLMLLHHGKVNPAALNNMPIQLAVASDMGPEIIQKLMSFPQVDPTAGSNFAFREALKRGQHHIMRLLLNDPRVDPWTLGRFVLTELVRHCHLLPILLNDKCLPMEAVRMAFQYALYRNCSKLELLRSFVCWRCHPLYPVFRRDYPVFRRDKEPELEKIPPLGRTVFECKIFLKESHKKSLPDVFEETNIDYEALLLRFALRREHFDVIPTLTARMWSKVDIDGPEIEYFSDRLFLLETLDYVILMLPLGHSEILKAILRRIGLGSPNTTRTLEETKAAKIITLARKHRLLYVGLLLEAYLKHILVLVYFWKYFGCCCDIVNMIFDVQLSLPMYAASSHEVLVPESM